MQHNASILNTNGILASDTAAVHSAWSRAARYGDSLTETMRMRSGEIFLLEGHWERLSASAAALGWPLPRVWSTAFFLEQIRRTAAANGFAEDCVIRLQCWPGDGHLLDGADAAQYIIQATQPPTPRDVTAIGISTNVVKPRSPLAWMKTGSALPYAVAARAARRSGWEDAILLNDAGRVADSCIANVWWLEGDALCTTPLADGGVAGVMRGWMLDFFPQYGWPVAERVATTQTLRNARGLWLSNAVRGLWRARLVDNGDDIVPDAARDFESWWKIHRPAAFGNF